MLVARYRASEVKQLWALFKAHELWEKAVPVQAVARMADAAVQTAGLRELLRVSGIV